jgi:hypothetical protein
MFAMAAVCIVIIAFLYTNGNGSARRSNGLFEDFTESTPSIAFTTSALLSIQPLMPVYLTTYRPASFDGSGLSWKNLAPSKTIDNATFTFDMAPPFDKSAAPFVSLSNTMIKGPQSQALGISAADGTVTSPFTIVWFARNAADAPADSIQTLFEIYANTVNNMGLGVYLRKNKDGSNVSLVINNAGDAEMSVVNKSPADGFNLFGSDGLFHMYTLVKSKDTISVYFDDKATPILQATKLTEVLPLSNKNMCIGARINSSGMKVDGWRADLRALTVFTKAMTLQEMSELYQHYREEELVYSNTVKGLNVQIDQLKKSIDATKTCPFVDVTLCSSKCPKIVDWSNLGTVVKSADDTCINGIVKYCNDSNANKNEDICAIWKSDYIKKYAITSGVMPDPAVAAAAAAAAATASTSASASSSTTAPLASTSSAFSSVLDTTSNVLQKTVDAVKDNTTVQKIANATNDTYNDLINDYSSYDNGGEGEGGGFFRSIYHWIVG